MGFNDQFRDIVQIFNAIALVIVIGTTIYKSIRLRRIEKMYRQQYDLHLEARQLLTEAEPKLSIYQKLLGLDEENGVYQVLAKFARVLDMVYFKNRQMQRQSSEKKVFLTQLEIDRLIEVLRPEFRLRQDVFRELGYPVMDNLDNYLEPHGGLYE